MLIAALEFSSVVQWDRMLAKIKLKKKVVQGGNG
jgi:hypothetical protein